ncbi:ribosomal protein S18-alanine N-acetyltransferase [Vibrio navarrensis]|uniref:[Ribosomal protein bS18]-alanine N-acetyltransferase n=1 Tax=Vibrio navarrensis TaxID=29495 RepID=A0AAI9CT36_9VIBR|nr:ribosomal protein S18-alanine N-acetyltransferase [Vibrio navarrensis]ELN6931904.1 ribosomal protein S18-alanine N-acetyltransferase [Vibrio navarrensis]KGK20526.1 alanine acetyltransferase [Vibrio navarrensis]MBE3663636.1 ribosomal-protein-alanine N-acetyltransferase [Vibrio navarrensis]MBE4574158.1 ribosomal-protein-alanine N-acetyltransferase [Vibrio navarrensis]MBE4598806.1 ribosomal-protein-alanine N-acetyltransferase [Vibrio navarrensis]
MSCTLVAMNVEHLDAVYQIETHAHSHPWAQSLIRDLSSRGAMHHVMLVDGNVVGYFYAQNIVGELTLLNIAVCPTQQGKGYGRHLLESFIELGEQQNAESAWLEVRESNQRALALYQEAGFNEVDRRRNYYPTQTGQEDAIIMSYLFNCF